MLLFLAFIRLRKDHESPGRFIIIRRICSDRWATHTFLWSEKRRRRGPGLGLLFHLFIAYGYHGFGIF